MKKIRRKKKPVPVKTGDEHGLPASLKRVEALIRRNYQRVAIVGMVVLCAAIFVSVYVGYSHRRQGEALRALEKALMTDALETRALLLEDLVNKYDGTRSAGVALYYLGDARYNNLQYDLARKRYEEYLKKYPRASFAPDAKEGLGYCAEAENKFDEAIEHYRELYEEYGDSYLAQHAWYDIARCQEERGDWAGAVDAYEKQLSLYPDSAWFREAETRLGEVRLRLSSAHLEPNADEFSVAGSTAVTAENVSN